MRLNEQQQGIVDFILNKIRQEFRERPQGYKAVVTSSLTELLVFLSRCFDEQSMTGEFKTISRMGAVISKIETDFKSDITLDDLAEIYHMSKRNFSRCFNNVFNTSPITYLLQVRVNNAKNMLSNTDMSIGEIAYASGFRDSNYFARHFKNLTSQTPRNYRKNNQIKSS